MLTLCANLHPSQGLLTSNMDCCTESACSKPDDDILDIPLDDPGANAAAAKIQATETRPGLSIFEVSRDRWMPRPLRSDETSLPCL
ncbi:hypothetical protein AB1E18_019109 [Capra hircus]